MAPGKSKTFEEIDDVSEMIDLMNALGISHNGLTSLDEMKNQVRMKWNPSVVEEPSWTAGQVRILLKCMPLIRKCVGNWATQLMMSTAKRLAIRLTVTATVLKSFAFLLSYVDAVRHCE